MPMTPLPALCISSSTEATSSGLRSSMISPSGLIRARSTSTNGFLADGAQRVHAVAARAMGADDLFFLGLHQVFHRPCVLGRPVLLAHAVQQHDVDVVDAQLQPIALEVAAGVGDVGRVGLGLDDVLVAGNALERLAQIDVRAVLVGDVEEPNALVERMADDLGEFLDAQAGLVARLARADAAGSHADQRDLDAGLAQRDLVGRALGQGQAGCAAGAALAVTSETAAITAVVAAAVLTMKSRRFTWPVMTSISRRLFFNEWNAAGCIKQDLGTRPVARPMATDSNRLHALLP